MGTFLAPVADHLILPARVSLTAGDESNRRRLGRSIPAPVAVLLLIDTGSKRTTLSPGVIRHLNPAAGQGANIITPSKPLATTLYWIHLDFPGIPLAGFEHVQVARMEMPPMLRLFHGLLGRDLQSRWEALLYEGRRGRYVVRDKPGPFSWLRRWL